VQSLDPEPAFKTLILRTLVQELGWSLSEKVYRKAGWGANARKDKSGRTLEAKDVFQVVCCMEGTDRTHQPNEFCDINWAGLEDFQEMLERDMEDLIAAHPK
jgi:isopentenyldiphosphate isomerase